MVEFLPSILEVLSLISGTEKTPNKKTESAVENMLNVTIRMQMVKGKRGGKSIIG